MKKDDERILKYLSELMDAKERILFEEELAASQELKSDFESSKNRLEDFNLSKSIETDERYFANLLPRVRERLEKRKKILSWRSAYFITPSMAAVAVLFILLLNSKSEFETQYKDLASEVLNNFSDKDVSENFFTELESNPADAILTQNSDPLSVQIPLELEINSESYSRLIDNSNAEEYSTLNRLSESDLEIVYEKLNSTTSQKVAK